VGIGVRGAARRRPGGVARSGLDAARDATAARVGALRAELAGIVESSEGANADDEHDPEGATIAFERQRVASLLEAARCHLGALDAARDRAASGSYGTCEACGGRIGDERLEALPAATRCVACATTPR
jgi:DnaK suppressor protein